jgi:transforming growth factor-beta-induced protein
MMLSSLLVAAMALPAPALDGCSSSQGCSSTRAVAASVKEKSILETAVAAGQFNTLAAALKAGDLLEPLSGEGPFTVFAPTDAAFAALPEGTLDSLLKPEAKGTLQAILTYHVVPGRLDAEHVVKSANAATLNGQRVGFKVDDHGAFINGAKIVKTDIHCSNGIIHVIDAVILPSTKDVVATAVEAGSFKTLAAALKAAQLVEALQGDGPFTVFAPNDAAFAALPAGTVDALLKPENLDKLQAILKYHVVPGRVYADAAAKGATVRTLNGQSVTTRSTEGGFVFVGQARVLDADIETSNGVIHVVDRVLLPE